MAVVEPSSVNCVIYHADCTDGFGSAYSAWKLLGNRAEYHACKHGTPPPDVTGKVVAILDFSYSNAVTKKMIEDADGLIIIDHHKSAIVELHDISNTHFVDYFEWEIYDNHIYYSKNNRLYKLNLLNNKGSLIFVVTKVPSTKEEILKENDLIEENLLEALTLIL